jgi:hypothetical protein
VFSQVPQDGALCLTDDLRRVRRDLLLAKGDGITDDQIELLLDAAEERNKRQVDFFKSLLSSDSPVGDLFYGGQDPQEYIRRLIPAVGENRPASHMMKITVNGMIDPIARIYDSATENGKMVSSSTLIDDVFVAKITSSLKDDLISQRGPDFVFKDLSKYYTSGRGLQNYQTSLGLLQHQLEYDGPEAAGQFFINNVEGSVPRDWRNLVELMMEKVSKTADVTKDNYNQVLEKVNETLDPEGLQVYLENCWDGLLGIREGILVDFQEKEAITRDSSVFTKSVVEGLLYLASRLEVLDFCVKTAPFLTRFPQSEYVGKMMVDYLTLRVLSLYGREIAQIMPFLDRSILEIRDIVKKQAEAVFFLIVSSRSLQPGDRIGSATATSVSDLILFSLPRVNFGSAPPNQEKLYYENYIRLSTGTVLDPPTRALRDGETYGMRLIFEGESGQLVLSDTTSEYLQNDIAMMIRENINSDIVQTMFSYSVPLKEFLSMQNIYLFELTNRNITSSSSSRGFDEGALGAPAATFEDIRDLLKINMNTNLNIDNFEYEDESLRRRMTKQ